MNLPQELITEIKEYSDFTDKEKISYYSMKLTVQCFYESFNYQYPVYNERYGHYNSIQEVIKENIGNERINDLLNGYRKLQLLRVCHDTIEEIESYIPYVSLESIPHGKEFFKYGTKFNEWFKRYGKDYIAQCPIPMEMITHKSFMSRTGEDYQYLNNMFSRISFGTFGFTGACYDPNDPMWDKIHSIIDLTYVYPDTYISDFDTDTETDSD